MQHSTILFVLTFILTATIGLPALSTAPGAPRLDPLHDFPATDDFLLFQDPNPSFVTFSNDNDQLIFNDFVLFPHGIEENVDAEILAIIDVTRPPTPPPSPLL